MLCRILSKIQTKKLVSLVCSSDLNEDSSLGFSRVTDYEVEIINQLYVLATITLFNPLKVYLYDVIGKITRMQISISRIPGLDISPTIDSYANLIDSLKLYHMVVFDFYYLRKRDFADQIIDIVNQLLAYQPTEEMLAFITHSYVTLLNDMSYFYSKKRLPLWTFTRDELYKLFELESLLIKKCKQSAIERPLKGVLMTTISNYVLKSRNEYNDDLICKYTSKKVSKLSIYNNELWMNKIEFLNDKRELKVVPELFSTRNWLNYDWAKSIDLKPTRTYFVSSFSKSTNNETMKEKYGQCIYGYKTDRIAELISPIYIVKGKKNLPRFSQVVSFDILYDNNKVKEEINFLCSIVDMYELSDKEKNQFFEEIIQYWLLSVKDKKWGYEKERRYVVFLYNGYDYLEMSVDERFLKAKTSLLNFPDFILGSTPVKYQIRTFVDNKRLYISQKDYLFCYDCFNRDYDYLTKDKHKCSICNSTNIEIVQVGGKKKD